MSHLLGISGQSTPALTRASSPTFPLTDLSHSAPETPRTPEGSSSQLVQDNWVPVDELVPEVNREINDDSADFTMVARAIASLKSSDTIQHDGIDTASVQYFISRGPSESILRGPPRRKALLIAVADAGDEGLPILHGPRQDVEQVKMFLEGTPGWSSDCITMLKDGQSYPRKPTRRNILLAFEQLVEDARPDDRLFLYYAGHGLQAWDNDGDETDGWDEVITTSDGGYIIDDVLHEKLAQRIPPGCHLTAVFDCCNSGTGLDLQYNWCSNPSQKPPVYKGFIKPCPGDIVLLAACEDGKESHEWPTHIPTQSPVRGMFTREVMKGLQENGRRTVGDLMRTVRKGLEAVGRECRQQYPQVSSSQPIREVLKRPLYL